MLQLEADNVSKLENFTSWEDVLERRGEIKGIRKVIEFVTKGSQTKRGDLENARESRRTGYGSAI